MPEKSGQLGHTAGGCLPGRRPRPWLLLLVLCVTAAGAALADDKQRGSFRVTEIRTQELGGVYRLDARLEARFSSGALEALENGIPLVVELQVQVYGANPWLWDVIVSEQTQRRQIQYHALSRRYLVRNLDSGDQYSFHRREDALLEVGSLVGLPLLESGLLEAGKSYFVRLRGSLDIESLPTPVRLLAYVSPAWDMSSEWHALPLPPPAREDGD